MKRFRKITGRFDNVAMQYELSIRAGHCSYLFLGLVHYELDVITSLIVISFMVLDFFKNGSFPASFSFIFVFSTNS